MTQADQLLASLAVLRRQWRRRILVEALAWVALAAVIGLVVAFAISRFTPTSGPGLIAIRVVAYGIIAGTGTAAGATTETAGSGSAGSKPSGSAGSIGSTEERVVASFTGAGLRSSDSP